jgi:hypothetical protein
VFRTFIGRSGSRFVSIVARAMFACTLLPCTVVSSVMHREEACDGVIDERVVVTKVRGAVHASVLAAMLTAATNTITEEAVTYSR